MKRKILRGLMWTVLAVLVFVCIMVVLNWNLIQRTMLGGLKVYETASPVIPADVKRPAILVFSKTNGFRHEEAIPAANALFARMATENGWGHFQTENGAAFTPTILSRFDAVVFNNVSGDVFTSAQRQAFKSFLEAGGGFVGVHGSGGDFSYDWQWYVRDLIGAQFRGHPMYPQFQQATLMVEDKDHPATAALPARWSRIDEWYSFEATPRWPGFRVLLTLDEGSYANRKIFGKDLSMGADHPIAWSHCIGKGRVFYSAMGHQASAYSEPHYRSMLLGATSWALRQEGKGCDPKPANDEKGANR